MGQDCRRRSDPLGEVSEAGHPPGIMLTTGFGLQRAHGIGREMR